MKGWNEYFENKTEQVNEEHHKKTKTEQIEWICDILGKMSDEEVEEIYDYIENKLDVE